MAKETIDLVVKTGEDSTCTVQATVNKNFVQKMEARLDEDKNKVKDEHGNVIKDPTSIHEDKISVAQPQYLNIMKEAGVSRATLEQINFVEDNMRLAAEDKLTDRAVDFLKDKKGEKDTLSSYSFRGVRGGISGEILSRKTTAGETKVCALKRKSKVPASAIKDARKLLVDRFEEVLK